MGKTDEYKLVKIFCPLGERLCILWDDSRELPTEMTSLQARCNWIIRQFVDNYKEKKPDPFEDNQHVG